MLSKWIRLVNTNKSTIGASLPPYKTFPCLFSIIVWIREKLKMIKPITRKEFIKKSTQIITAASLFGGKILLSGCKPQEPFDLVIKNGRIIDMTGNEIFTADIGISGPSITQIGNIPESKGKSHIDAREKHIIPGLTDMHVHFQDRAFCKLFLLNGVTQVRDMGNHPDFILSLRDEINSQASQGPTIFASGPLINNRKIPFGASAYTHVVRNPAQARRLVAQLAERKVDWIKIYMTLPRDMVSSVIDEAQKHNIPVAGHLRRVNARLAAQWGIRTIEHATGIAESLLGEDVFRDVPPTRTISPEAWLHVDRTKYESLIDLFIEKNIYITANLTLYQKFVSSPEELQRNPNVRLMPKKFQRRWETYASNRFQKVTKERESWEITKKRLEEFLLLFKERGGKVLAGTDTPWPYLVPGFSLHKELELLVRAGFSPTEALLTATQYPAEALNQKKKLGTVEKGKAANLILLKSNPLDDIRNTQKIDTVIKRGKVIHREKLYNQLLNQSGPSKE